MLLYPASKMQIPHSYGLHNDIASLGDAHAPDAFESKFWSLFWEARCEGPHQLLSYVWGDFSHGYLVAEQINLSFEPLGIAVDRYSFQTETWKSKNLNFKNLVLVDTN